MDTLFNLCESASGLATDLFVLDATSCIEYTGINPGRDTACLVICDADQVCDTTVILLNVIAPVTDTVSISLTVGSDTTYCPDLSELSEIIDQIENYCASETNEITEIILDSNTHCANITSLAVGETVACLVLCDNFGICDTTLLQISVLPNVEDQLLLAVDDDTLTGLNEPVVLDVLLNDTIEGELVNLGIIDLPENGTVFVNPDNTISYTPNDGFCDPTADILTYFIDDGIQRDTATVYIQVMCEDLVVYSGFSPNGDGVNDIFVILGIEAFPDNEVIVFNRWGSEVYSRKGYRNSEGWDGIWEGNQLPDGTYFYIINAN